jgi:hypothetical protein
MQPYEVKIEVPHEVLLNLIIYVLMMNLFFNTRMKNLQKSKETQQS